MTSTAILFAKQARRYLALTLGYGLTRAVTWDYSGKKEYYNREKVAYEEKEMLITDKIGRITCNTWAAVTAWPLMLSEDFRRLEFAVTGKSPSHYVANR
jgi:hypothetical protein